jgi:hypothetical protein
MNRFNTLFFQLLALVVVWGVGCNLPEDPSRIARPNWEPHIAVPLVNSQIQISDVLPNPDSLSFLKIGPDGLISLVYEAELFELDPEELVEVPEISVLMPDSSFNAPFPLQRLQQVSLKQGNFTYELNGSHVGPTDVRIRVFNAIDDQGQFFEETVRFNSPGTLSGSFDLAGYDLLVTDGTVGLSYEALTPMTGQRHLLAQCRLGFTDFAYDYVEANFGQYVFNMGADSVLIEFPDEVRDVDFTLTDPRLQFIIHNSYGIPVEVKANTLAAQKPGGSQVSVSSQELSDGLVLAYPTLSEVGERKTTIIELNKDNSDFPAAISPLPEALVFDFTGTAHPDGDTTQIGFVTDSSSFGVDLGIEIPLDGTLAPYTLADTFEFDVSEADILQSAGLILITENGLPLELSAQVYFLDEQQQVIDSLFSSGFSLAGAAVDAQGVVNQISEQRMELELTEARMDALQAARSFAFRASFATTQAGSVPVKIYDHYVFGLKMGLSARVSPF